MAGFAQLVIMQLDQGDDGLVDGGQLNEGHLAILGEKLEGLDVESDGLEGRAKVILLDRRRNIGQMKRR